MVEFTHSTNTDSALRMLQTTLCSGGTHQYKMMKVLAFVSLKRGGMSKDGRDKLHARGDG